MIGSRQTVLEKHPHHSSTLKGSAWKVFGLFRKNTQMKVPCENERWCSFVPITWTYSSRLSTVFDRAPSLARLLRHKPEQSILYFP